MDTAERPSPFLPVLLAWLLPGAGHFALRRPWPGLFVALAILPLFVAGLLLSGLENVSWVRHPWYFSLQQFTGLPALIAALATKTLVPTEVFAHRAAGDLFTCVAGLLNVVAIADVWARGTAGDPESRLSDEKDEGSSAEAGGVESLLRQETTGTAAEPAPAAGTAQASDAEALPPTTERRDG
jgi:hypothetical protein